MLTSTAISKRYSCRSFKENAPVPEEELTKILALTQRAPTCFNSQPYVAVVVRKDTQPSVNAKMVEAMFAGNQQRVQQAPLTIVFCGDLEPARNVDRIVDLSVKLGYPRDETKKKFSVALNVVATHILPLKLFMNFIAKPILMPLVGLFKPVMTGMFGESGRTWAIKQAMFPASTFMIAATASGLATAAMEGFDAGRVRKSLGLPRRYIPALVISCGYAADNENPKRPKKESLRFDGSQVFFDGNYDKPMEGIKPVVVLEKDKTK